jgi:endonuclease/exonuclease/phosphatase (EEP) superfamily protein YafD
MRQVIAKLAPILSLLALALVAAALAGRAAPALDLFSNLLLAWVAIALAGVLAWLAGGRVGRWAPAAGLIAVALACVVASRDLIVGPHGPAAEGPGARLRLVQMNVWKENIDQPRTAAWILSQAPDVVVIEEGGGAALTPLRERLQAQLPYLAGCHGGLPCEVMIFSRAPLAAEGRLRGVKQTPSMYVVATWARLSDPPGVMVAGVHKRWPDLSGVQSQETWSLALRMRQFDLRNAILAGDFNSAGWSQGMMELERSLGMRRVTHGLLTWPARETLSGRAFPVPIVGIDHVLIGSNVQVRSVRRGPRLGSDHYPVVVDLTIGAQAGR